MERKKPEESLSRSVAASVEARPRSVIAEIGRKKICEREEEKGGERKC